MAKLVYVIIVLASTSSLCSGSAIPMWEYLGRTEKMSHLYSMFAKEVSKYCKTNGERSVAKCKHDLLSYGLLKLDKMDESHLDEMDPYQRSATDILWGSMMDGHPMMASKIQHTTNMPIRQPTGLFEKNPLFDDIEDGATAGKQNKPAKIQDYGSGMDVTYGVENIEEPKNHLPLPTNLEYQYEPPTPNYVIGPIGPMVVRVMPDGSPVAADKDKPLPVDDDRDAMSLGSKGFLPPVQTPSTRLQAPDIPQTTFFTRAYSKPISTTYHSNYRTISRRIHH